MKKTTKKLKYFSLTELILWFSSVFIICAAFFIFDGVNYLTLCASLVGVTSLIFNAKGNAAGQALMIVFSILYGIISFSFAYYGEMITYLGMTGPMALFALIAWLKNPYRGKKSEVKINSLRLRECVFMIVCACIVTSAFYFILKAFRTPNLLLSAISVATSFLAVYLTFRRSAYFALAYAANDVILIWMWILATMNDVSYLSVVICFVVFFINDIYGFVNWTKIKKRQTNADESTKNTTV